MDCNRCEQLAKELDEAKKEIKRLERLLSAIADVARGAAVKAAFEMEKGDIGRSQWAWHRSQLELANVILTVIGLDEIKLRKRFKGLAGFGQDLFTGIFGR